MLTLAEFPFSSPGPEAPALPGPRYLEESSIARPVLLTDQVQVNRSAPNSPQDMVLPVLGHGSLEGDGFSALAPVLNSLSGTSTRSVLHTVAWHDDSYVPLVARPFVGEGRIGNTVTGGGTFELDIGPSTASPYQTADYRWTQYPEGHLFALIYDAKTDFAYFYNNDTLLWYPTQYTGDPAQDTLFVRANATREGSYILVGSLYLYTPALGDYVPVPFADGDPGPAYADAGGPNGRSSLQILGVTLQDGFVLFGYSYWIWETEGPNRPSQSQLAFQLTAGTWLGT